VFIIEKFYRFLNLTGYRIQCGINQNTLVLFRGTLVLPAGGENQNEYQA
jgi:hypothetical protein